MRRVFVIVVALTLAAAFPVAAQSSANAAHCAALAASSGTHCCGSAPAAPECTISDCAGAGAALLVGSPDRGHAARISVSPATFVVRLVDRPARAPDTAPPKPAV
jgi:hypothetical protein